jgi:hypothetical protein
VDQIIFAPGSLPEIVIYKQILKLVPFDYPGGKVQEC